MRFSHVDQPEDESVGPPPGGAQADRRLRGDGRFLGRLITVLVILFVIYLLASVAKGVYAEWLWFESVGYQSVYATILVTELELFAIGAVAFFAIFMANILLAWRFSPKMGAAYFLWERQVGSRRAARLLVWGIAIVLSLIFGWVTSRQWDTVLRYFNAQPFGMTEPIFNTEIGFYVFTLPFYQLVQKWLLIAFGVALVGAFLVYALSLSVQRVRFTFTPPMKRHLFPLAAVIALVFAWGYSISVFELLYSPRGAIFGASYTDVNAQWLAYNMLIGAAVLCAILLVVGAFRRTMRLALLGIVLWIAVFILAGAVYPWTMQNFQVVPNELALETPYIKNNIALTRHAFALDRIEEQAFPAGAMPTEQELRGNPDTMNNIRLWDHRPLKDTYNQIQAIRLYYDFHDVDVDRYTIDGNYRQVMLSAREFSIDKLPTAAKTWVNEQLQFTHGYGLAMSPVTEVSREGLPVLLEKDVPPVGIFNISRPEIYYGEDTNQYVIVKTNTREFDYPKGEDNIYTTYQGRSGVVLDSALRRFVYAWEFGDINILISTELTSQSSLLYYRNIAERVQHIAPFLKLDADPYLVVADGKLYWIQDGYTVTKQYPYSQPYRKQFNYIRNSAKAVIDAYDGSVTFYLADPTDPLIQTYRAIFPALFQPLDSMPASLRPHIRYPEDMFMVQAEMYLTYHMLDARVFYNKEDQWAVPHEVYAGTEQPMEAYYVNMRVPGAAKEEFLLMLPFTPVNKANTIGWLAAHCDGANYGKLLAFKFPKEKLVYGPMQIQNRINQETAITEKFALWSRGGSRFIQGNLLLIPIGESLFYVEPIFLQAEATGIPQLKAAIVAAGDHIAMEDTLSLSIARIYGKDVIGGPPPVTPPPGEQPPPDVVALVQLLQQHYAQALEYLKAGDWAGYGNEQKAIQDIIAQLAQLTAGGSTP